MMAAGAESPSVATQSAKTDILQKIGQRGNNHQEDMIMEDESELQSNANQSDKMTDDNGNQNSIIEDELKEADFDDDDITEVKLFLVVVA